MCLTLRQGEGQKPHGDKGNMGKSFYINISNSKVGLLISRNVGVNIAAATNPLLLSLRLCLGRAKGKLGGAC